MKFRVSTNPAAIQESTGSTYISKSGIYDCTIKFASLDVAKSGAESVNFNLDYEGNSQTIYGPYVTDKEGNTLEIGAKLINKLAIIAGMTDGDDFVIEQETHAVGKDNKEQEFAVITNFTDLPIKIRLQEEYSINPKTNEIQKRMVIKNFFAENGASADELVNNTEIGKRIVVEQEKYASNVTYKDNISPEAVAEWKASKASGTSTPKPIVNIPKSKPAGSLFK